jgi:hypothetical protein
VTVDRPSGHQCGVSHGSHGFSRPLPTDLTRDTPRSRASFQWKRGTRDFATKKIGRQLRSARAGRTEAAAFQERAQQADPVPLAWAGGARQRQRRNGGALQVPASPSDCEQCAGLGAAAQQRRLLAASRWAGGEPPSTARDPWITRPSRRWLQEPSRNRSRSPRWPVGMTAPGARRQGAGPEPSRRLCAQAAPGWQPVCIVAL